MKGEINCDYYCALGRDKRKQKKICHNECASCNCEAYHRKWPTPEQFREEYNEEWDGAYYTLIMDDENTHWEVNNKVSIEYFKPKYNVCASSPWGRPKDNWRP